MRIAIIAPGEMPIPPKGWGAVEAIIDEYQTELKKRGHEVLVVNTKSRSKIVEEIALFKPDFVHCQYDEFIDVLPKVDCRFKAITSHYGYLDQVWSHKDYLVNIHKKIVRAKDVYIFALSQSIANTYIKDGVDPKRVRVIPNGVNFEKFAKDSVPEFVDRSICLAKVDSRKRQGMIQSLDINVDFAGNLCPHTAISSGFDPYGTDYLGEWNKEKVFSQLTKYPNLILLSDGEAHPLVCLEALCSGLGLVLSEFATANLDLSLPFIDVVPESKMTDIGYIKEIVDKNRKSSIRFRSEIFSYAATFDWTKIIDRYLETVTDILNSEVLSAPLKKIGIVTVATGNYYDKFIPDLKKSVDDYMGEEVLDVNFYCFTDHAPVDKTIKYIPSRYLGWPFDTLLRYALFNRNIDEMMTCDFLLYVDADMEFKSKIDISILSEELVAVIHPGFLKPWKTGTFEIEEGEASCVTKSARSHYYQGCLWGGDSIHFKLMVTQLSDMIDSDLLRSRIPIWHDESYLNFYLSKEKCKALSPAYAYPQGSLLDFDPILIHKIKPHNEIRSIDNRGVSSLDIINGLDSEKALNFYKSLYLTAHEKNQRLELLIIKKEAIFSFVMTVLKPIRSILNVGKIKFITRILYRKIFLNA